MGEVILWEDLVERGKEIKLNLLVLKINIIFCKIIRN